MLPGYMKAERGTRGGAGEPTEISTQAKKWYDKRARDITLVEGDKVLVLLPTRTEKLLAKWKGPYKVLRKVGRVNYEIEVPGGRKEKKLFHVNMLKLWTNPEENFVNYIPDEQDELPCFVRDVQ